MLYACIVVAAIVLFALVTNDCRANDSPATVHFDKPIDPVKLAHAIALVENWDGISIGQHGERGRLQMKPAVYAQWSDRPASYCLHLLDCCDKLGKKRSVFLASLIHHAGFTAVKQQRFTFDQSNFALRCLNCYQDETADGK